MKVLWFTSQLMPAACTALGQAPNVKGGWMPSLAQAVVDSGAMDLGVASVIAGAKPTRVTAGGLTHYVVPAYRGEDRYQVGRLPSTSLMRRCLTAVEEFQPDLVHFHGTEAFYGLLASEGYLQTPAVISLQGIIHGIVPHYSGDLSFSDLLRANVSLEWLLGRSLYQEQRKWARRGELEKRLIAGNHFFMGRTRWDRAHVLALNPKAVYYHCEELIRPPFYGTKWDLASAARHTIFASSGSYPLKGFHLLLRAVALLRQQLPDIKLRVADALPTGRSSMKGYPRYLRWLIHKLNLENNVIPLGTLNADQMAAELAAAHAFVIPSLIENSPNSLVEAMLIGTPAVASLCGGIPSMVEDNKTALCFPPGDEAAMSECIRILFTDDALAQRLSTAARTLAHERNDKDKVVKTLLDIYEDIIRQHASALALEP